MKFENTETWGWKHSLRGMRNPLESWSKSDSEFSASVDGVFKIGKKDLDLMKRLIKSGPEHRKFMRQIFVSVDITAGLFWWKEADQYRIGVTTNSTSTMHKLAATPITPDCFEHDDFSNFERVVAGEEWAVLLGVLEDLRRSYNNTKDKRYWKALIRLLPESWLQTRTITMSYENVYNMVHQRYNHKLNEWSGKDDPSKPNFISWARTLPHAQELIFLDLEGEEANG